MKYNTKKFISILIAMTSITVLSSCGNTEQENTGDEEKETSTISSSSNTETTTTAKEENDKEDEDLPKEPVDVDKIFTNSLNKQYSSWPDDKAQKLTSAKGIGSEEDKEKISNIALPFFDIVYNYLSINEANLINNLDIENNPGAHDSNAIIEELEKIGFFNLFVPDSLNQVDKEKLLAFMNVIKISKGNNGEKPLDIDNTIILKDFIYISDDGKYANIPEYAVWNKDVEPPESVPNKRLLVFEKIDGDWYITPDFIRELQLSS